MAKTIPGSEAHERFEDMFQKTLIIHDNEYLKINVVASDMGTHSIWKGAATYSCAGVHPEPPVISVCL